MGKEANLRHKSTKTPVQLYRAFLKLSLAGAIYAAYCVYTAGEIAAAGFAAAVSILGAIGYEITYLVYKTRSKQNRTKAENTTWKQVVLLLKFSGFLLGVGMLLYGASLLHDKNNVGIIVILISLVLCQQMHNNSSIFSHLSTFCENSAVGFAVITLERLSITDNLSWLFAATTTVVLYFLSEFFFHFFNCHKHLDKEAKKNGKKLMAEIFDTVDPKTLTDEQFQSEMKKQDRRIFRSYLRKRTLILDRIAEFLRNTLLVVAIWAVFALLIISGSVAIAKENGIYEKAIAIIPIIISIATPAINSQKKKDEKEALLDKYDPRIERDEFKKSLKSTFGDKALSVKALDYVCDKMNAKYRLVRYNGEDYYVHPVAVAKIIIDNTNEEDEVVATALLHDCIEDIWNCDYELLEKEYGARVAGYVRLLSKDPAKDYHDPKVMQKYLDDISKVPAAAIVKLADRINNVHTMDNCTDEEKKLKWEQTRKFYPPFLEKAMANDNNKDNDRFYKFAKECFEQKKD